jgi:hypothetical protein
VEGKERITTTITTHIRQPRVWRNWCVIRLIRGIDMSKKVAELHGLIHDLRKSYPIGEGQHTYGACAGKCGNSARGSGFCPVCLENKIAGLINSKRIAGKIHDYIVAQRDAINSALDLIQKGE